MSEIPMFPGYSEGTMQWKAQSLQMVNWGGFHGHHVVEFAPGSTLLSGASGTGKSTLLDAYLALMMPSTVPFNGASNDATQGRARGVDQRNVLSYLRGKRDSARDGEALTDEVLRGEKTPVWGALAMTFVDDRGRLFTALRVYYAAAGATRSTDVLARKFTLGGALDLSELEEFAERRFDPRSLRARFAGLSYHDTDLKFTDALTTRLGIGANGGGDNALRLLARIQAGYQVKTVDSLYKQMVLEEPQTFAVADRALEQFRSLNQAYEDLETDGAKVHALERIDALHAAYLESHERARRLDTFGLAKEGGQTPFSLWALLVEQRLLGEAEEANRRDRTATRSRLVLAKENTATLASELAQVQERQRAEGGGALDLLTSRLDEARSRAERIEHARHDLDRLSRSLGMECDNAAALASLQAQGADFLAAAPEREAALGAERDAQVEAAPLLKARRAELQAEHESLRSRDGRVPVGHDAARRQIAEACGLRAEDLPFAAELLDIAPEHASWRHAAEVTLRGVGLTLLMDARRQQQIRESIDSLRLETRVSFEGVDLSATLRLPQDSGMVSGKLILKDSPFSAWVAERVTRPGVDHLCVDTAAELGGELPKVTPQGQTSRGSGGAHGRSRGQQDILGFSNADRRREIEQEAESLTARLGEHEDVRAAIGVQLASLRSRCDAFTALATVRWEQVDTAAAQAQVESLSAQLDELLEKSDLLGALRQREQGISAELETAREELVRARDHERDLEAAWSALTDRQDQVSDGIEQLRHEAGVELDQDDHDHLDVLLRERDDEVDHRGLAKVVRALRHELDERAARERKAADAAREALEGTFAHFNQRWPDPNRGAGVESYEEFRGISEEIKRHGLFERRQVFSRRFQNWSGNDLKLLHDAYDASMADIEERLEPVNQILESLPFGPQGDRLRIEVRRLAPEALVSFRRRLRELSSDVASEWSEAESEQRFERLREFMGLLAQTEGKGAARRDELLDVRKHLEMTAARLGPAGNVISSYASLGGKSGGESQELVAFIVGSALRYQLGDETRTRPRFAPVFLDEGFVKSDSEFAGRAVQAWIGLGFQLVIGAPLDKVTALEPHMDLNLSVTKNQVTGYSFVTPFRDAEPAV
ncbi:ATP-binding protein [Galactobacter caseinivorans]|uniref:ATP-binding protein n=1 Tax=Galactobacter caseinivorans TaxID=2676123 RepID=A0A496PKW4_9MICC|nr:ATP-binding protein [Galactobacter caseinivorans]RKW71128.1 hypothetical protein DWQ67_04895 [Galactobacter caseinivorans]